MTPADAKDEMLAVFHGAWNALGYIAIYDDKAGQKPTGSDETPWARVTLQHIGGGQTALGNSIGSKLYTNTGILTAQLFSPFSEGQDRLLPLVQLVQDAYRKARGNVWYRNVRFREQPRDGAFAQANVLVDFTYDSEVQT